MASGAKQSSHVVLYTNAWCAFCKRAKALLDRLGIAYEEIDVGDGEHCCRLQELTGGSSVPQVIVDGEPIGGYEELVGLVRSGALTPRRP